MLRTRHRKVLFALFCVLFVLSVVQWYLHFETIKRWQSLSHWFLQDSSEDETDIFSEKEVLRQLGVNCSLPDSLRHKYVTMTLPLGLQRINVSVGEYKKRRTEYLLKLFEEPFVRDPNLAKLENYPEKDSVQQAVSKIHDAGEAVSVKEITNYLLQEKLRRLKLGDDDLLEIPEVVNELTKDDAEVPNIVHFIYFGCLHVRVDVYIALIAALRYQKPALILFHTNCQPTGPYWDAFKVIAKGKLRIVKRSPPDSVWGKRIKVIEHVSDVARLQVLLEVGGIYVDTDSVILRSLDELRAHRMVLGEESDIDLGNGVILANKDAWFLKRWFWEYKYFKDGKWGHNSVIVPWCIWKIFPSTIHVVTLKMLRPNYMELNYLFRERIDWKDHYTIHLYSRARKDWEGIRERPLLHLALLGTTYGDVARHAIWGDKRVRDVTDWIVTCNVTQRLLRETVL